MPEGRFVDLDGKASRSLEAQGHEDRALRPEPHLNALRCGVSATREPLTGREKELGFRFFGLEVKGLLDKMRDVVKDKKTTFPILLDDRRLAREDLQISGNADDVRRRRRRAESARGSSGRCEGYRYDYRGSARRRSDREKIRGSHLIVRPRCCAASP